MCLIKILSRILVSIQKKVSKTPQLSNNIKMWKLIVTKYFSLFSYICVNFQADTGRGGRGRADGTVFICTPPSPRVQIFGPFLCYNFRVLVHILGHVSTLSYRLVTVRYGWSPWAMRLKSPARKAQVPGPKDYWFVVLVPPRPLVLQ